MPIIKRCATEDYVAQNAVLCTPQTLTKEQQDQVIKNLGISELGGGGSTTTEVDFNYNGDNTSSDKAWVTHTVGGKAFVKVGDIPNGTLNLVGGTIQIITPTNSWLNYEVVIDELMLSESIVAGGVSIPATTNGLTQIFYQHTSDQGPISLALICTKVGTYDISFGSWMEVITIQEKGIYLFDNRSYGGNKYACSLSCTLTTQNNSSVGGSSEPATPVDYKGNEMLVFNRGICIGDSVTEGVFNHNNGETTIKKYSYPTFLQRITGIDITNTGVAGLTSKTWYEASLDSTTQWGTWVNNEWVWNTNPQVGANDTKSTALDYSGYDFAVIHMGINDIGFMGDSTVDEMIATFEHYMTLIVEKLKTESKGIKIFLATIIPCFAKPGNTLYEALNDKIRQLAKNIEDAYLIDLNIYSSCATHTVYEQQHLTAIGYYKMASEIVSLISYTMDKNLSDFENIQFIGTNYTL